MSSREIETTADLVATVDALVDLWCERRSPKALRQILLGWSSTLGLTDDWGQLRDALRNVLALARPELSPDDIDAVEASIAAIDVAMNRAAPA